MLKDATLLILTSTYPRWKHDTTPAFVADFANYISPDFKTVRVLAPHSSGATRREQIGNIFVTRYRYFWPASAQTIAYSSGAVSKIKKTPLYAVQLLCFMSALFFNTLFTTIFKRVTIINAHWLIPQGFVGVLVKFLTGRKLVITVHGGDVLSLNSGILRTFKRFTLRYADTVCVNSSVTLTACQELYQREYVVVPMGITSETFAAGAPSLQLRQKYSLGDFTILFVGRLSKEKGVIYLLQALKQLHDSGLSFKALIVGSGSLATEFRTYIQSHGLSDVVTLVGWVDNDELPAYYKTADVMVGPSLFEAQGLVFLESVAAGLPVITTNSGGTKDFIQQEVNGLLVEPKSVDALVVAITTLYNDRSLLKKMAKRAPASIKNEYSWTAVAARYNKVFKAVV